MESEIYKDVIGYEGLYKVSNYGNIKSYKVNPDGKLMSPTTDKDGYKQIGIRDINYKRKYYRIHRLVAYAFIDNPNNYKFINHKDNNPANNNCDNLEWCTIEHNNKYRFTNGNASHVGSKHPQSKITEDIAKQIYILGHSGKYTEPEICIMFNTTRSVVNKIRLKISWKHIHEKI